MESFSVRTTLTPADWHALMLNIGARGSRAKQANDTVVTRFAPAAMWAAAVGAFVFLLNTDPPLMRPLGMAIAVMIFFGTWWAQYLVQRRAYVPDEKGVFLGPAEFDFSAQGFQARRANSVSSNRWGLVREVTHSDDHVFIWIDVFSAYVIPARDLPAPMTAPAAASLLREFVAAAASETVAESAAMPSPAPAPGAPAVASAEVPARPAVAQELAALLRLHAWGLVDGARLFGRDLTIILLGALSFVLWAGLDRLNYEGDVELFWYTISDTGVLVLAVLLLGWVMACTARPRVDARRTLALVLGYLPLFVVAIWIARKLPNIGVAVVAILMVGAAMRYLGAGMRSMTGKAQPIAIGAALVCLGLMLHLSREFYFSPSIWYTPEADPDQAIEAQRENEQLVFEQSSRLTAAIEKLAPREATATNAFFVGFAGYGGQRVFAEEIGLAAKRIGARYGSTARSILLVNDRRDNDKYPIATAPALRHALNGISKRMNVDEDVLFLSLSSHGSEDATISVNSELGYWRDLSAPELAEMLRESGIRWIVIVISACHAGSFIESLRDDGTIILTAAAAERTSFGCSDDNDLTYFGEAFYRDALPKAATLREAFDAARAQLERREKSEGITPSDPQAHFGAALEKKLAAMEARRDAPPSR